VEDGSVDQMRRLRSEARKSGLAIRTQRATRTRVSRAYDVIDRETGSVLCADIRTLVDVKTELWWIVRRRKQALSSPHPVNEAPEELCPACGTPRIAFFRLCSSCGLDYEPTRAPAPEFAPRLRSIGAGGVSSRSVTEAHLRQREVSPWGSIKGQLVAFAYDVGHGYRFGPLRQLAGGAILGLLVGGALTIALGGLR